MAADVLAKRNLDERKILIVGGGGYIGTVVSDHLLTHGYRVRCLDSLIYENQAAVLPLVLRPGYEFFRGDLCDLVGFEASLEGVTDVVLLAGLVGDPVTKAFPGAAERTNNAGHESMLRLLRGKRLNKVVFVSTCSNYGLIKGEQIAGEDFPLNPISLYAKSKVRFENILLDAARSIDFAPTVLRFATAFGLSSRMRFDLTVSEFIRDMYLGQELLVFDADTWRPYCHVRDFAEVIRRVLEAPIDSIAFEVFNAGGDANNYTKQMIVNAILEQLPNAKVRYQKHGSDPRNYRVNFRKIREILHFEPAVTVPEGIRELIAAMQSGLFSDISQPESFYGNWKPSLVAP